MLLTSAICGVLLFGKQASFSPARTYVIGERDIYAMSLRMDTNEYSVSILGKLSYEVKKLYENGDADLETKAYDMTINVLGQEMKQPGGDVRVIRYNKFGAPIERGIPKDRRQPIFMNFLIFRPSADMKVGDKVTIDETIDGDVKTSVKGTAKLESIQDGIAKVSASISVMEPNLKKPTRIESVGYFDAKTSKLNRSESKLEDVEPGEMPGMPPVKSITVVIERDR
jgi:hypothetical protein